MESCCPYRATRRATQSKSAHTWYGMVRIPQAYLGAWQSRRLPIQSWLCPLLRGNNVLKSDSSASVTGATSGGGERNRCLNNFSQLHYFLFLIFRWLLITKTQTPCIGTYPYQDCSVLLCQDDVVSAWHITTNFLGNQGMWQNQLLFEPFKSHHKHHHPLKYHNHPLNVTTITTIFLFFVLTSAQMENLKDQQYCDLRTLEWMLHRPLIWNQFLKHFEHFSFLFPSLEAPVKAKKGIKIGNACVLSQSRH